MGGNQNYGPFLGAWCDRGPGILRTQKLITTHMAAGLRSLKL